jgi:hypothetical protein
MRIISLTIAAAVLVFGLGLSSQRAFAQNAPSPAGNMQAPALQPKADDNQALPPALPGAGDQNLAAVPSVAKPQTGDPTAQLFDAINSNDYNSAQDAISRGADLNGENALGETPIDLSVSLNRNSITFMLLAARNDSGDDPDASGPVPATPAGGYSSGASATATSAAVPVKLIETPRVAPANDPGTPNASAGFLGFGK